MDTVKELLQQPLDAQNPQVLANQLVSAEAWQSRVSEVYRAAEAKLAEVRGKYFDPSLSSEDKRKIDLEYKTRSEQQTASELKDMADILQRRISLGQSLLSTHRTEIKSGLR